MKLKKQTIREMVQEFLTNENDTRNTYELKEFKSKQYDEFGKEVVYVEAVVNQIHRFTRGYTTNNPFKQDYLIVIEDHEVYALER